VGQSIGLFSLETRIGTDIPIGMRRPPPMSCPNYAESAPVRFSPELLRDLTCRSSCGLGKVKTSRGLTAAILEAAYGMPMMKLIQVWQRRQIPFTRCAV